MKLRDAIMGVLNENVNQTDYELEELDEVKKFIPAGPGLDPDHAEYGELEKQYNVTIKKHPTKDGVHVIGSRKNVNRFHRDTNEYNKMEEEIDADDEAYMLDEISKKALNSYHQKAKTSVNHLINKARDHHDLAKMMLGISTHEKDDLEMAADAGEAHKDEKRIAHNTLGKARKRITGMETAMRKMHKMKEEAESDEFDELDNDYASRAEQWDPANGPDQAVATVKAATQSGTKKQPARRGDKSNSEPMQKLTADGAFKEDLDALVQSEATLSEAFREKAEVIFEAALQSKLTEYVEHLEAEYQEQLSEETANIKNDLVEKIDGYLNYVVENWMEENTVAIENGLRTEIAESFMQALHGVFTEHYITVPESKVNIVDELAIKVDELEEQLNDSIARGIELTEQVSFLSREAVIRESAYDLSEAQAEKLKSLTEGIEFDSAETFAKKVTTIKESYFKKDTVKQSTDEAESLTEDTKTIEVSPMMQRYLTALKK